MSRSARIRFALAFVFILPSCSRAPAPAPKDLPTSTELKAAALRCDVPAFRAYMTPATATAIVEQDQEMQAIRQSLDDLFALAQKRFGAKVHRTPRGVKFDIDAKDPRWQAIFGPQWDTIKSAPGGQYFSVDADFFWKEECDVVRRFEACLGDKTFCSQPEIPGSVVQIRRDAGHWLLVWDESPERGATKVRLLAFLRSSIALSRDHLASAPSASSDEDVIVALATR